MTRNRTLPTLALAILLLVSPLAAASGSGHAHESGDSADDHADAAPTRGAAWGDLKTLLKSTDLDGARALYAKHFAPGEALQPVAAAVAADAFDALEGRTDNASAFYKAQVQLVDKSVYAIAYANVRAALETGDVDNASAWFTVLSAKFSKDTDLAGAKAAFAALTAENATAALVVLDAEYRDLIQAKVVKEAAEAPGLVAADPVKAAEEAAEALGYFLSIQPHFATLQGAEADTDLRALLAHLLEEVLEGEEAESQVLAEDVQDAVGQYALRAADNTLGAAYSDYARTLKADKDVAAATALYEANFAAIATQSAPAAHERILAAFTAATAALEADDNAEYQVQRQILEKSIYEIAFRHAFHEAAEGELVEAGETFRVLAVKFGYDETPAPAGTAFGRVLAANKADETLLATAQADLHLTFFGKVREEVEEVFIHWDDNAKAREKAMEGVVYFAPLKDDVALRLGQPVADELESELVELYEATTAGDRASVERIADEIEKLLVQYEADGREVTELDAIVSALKGKVDFVAEEYHGYFEAKAIGDETEAAIEMGEAKAFLAGARKQLTENRAAFDAVDATVVDATLADMDRIAEILDAVGKLEDLEALTDGIVERLQALLEQNAAPVETFGDVVARFGTPEAAGAGLVNVPLVLEGLPDEAALQLKVTFDAALLEAVEVEVPFGDVQTSDIQPGVVRFNAASTTAAEASETVAVLTFRLKGDAGTAALDLEAEELVDSKNRPYALTQAEGAPLDLAALVAAGASVTDGTTLGANAQGKDTPGFALVAGLAAVVVAALVGARRKEE